MLSILGVPTLWRTTGLSYLARASWEKMCAASSSPMRGSIPKHHVVATSSPLWRCTRSRAYRIGLSSARVMSPYPLHRTEFPSPTSDRQDTTGSVGGTRAMRRPFAVVFAKKKQQQKRTHNCFCAQQSQGKPRIASKRDAIRDGALHLVLRESRERGEGTFARNQSVHKLWAYVCSMQQQCPKKEGEFMQLALWVGVRLPHDSRLSLLCVHGLTYV